MSQVEVYKKAISGFEEHNYVYAYKHLKYSNEAIKRIINKNCQNQLNVEMIDSFIIFNKETYKTKWKMFGMEL